MKKEHVTSKRYKRELLSTSVKVMLNYYFFGNFFLFAMGSLTHYSPIEGFKNLELDLYIMK